MEDLADLMRANLGGLKDRATLREELEIATTYERIEKLRLGDRLAEEGIVEPVPCIVMEEGDDAAAGSGERVAGSQRAAAVAQRAGTRHRVDDATRAAGGGVGRVELGSGPAAVVEPAGDDVEDVLQAGLDDGDWTLTYQSRFGREEWLKPATAEVSVLPFANQSEITYPLYSHSPGPPPATLGGLGGGVGGQAERLTPALPRPISRHPARVPSSPHSPSVIPALAGMIFILLLFVAARR